MSSAKAKLNKEAFFEKIAYKPMPHQSEYHAAGGQSRFRIACAGRRAGKSHMAARDREPQLLIPKHEGWIVGPTYDLAAKEFRVMYTDLITPEGLGLGKDKRVKYNFSIKQGNMYIELPWGARVEVKSADKPDSLVGEGLDWIIVAEAAKIGEDVFGRYIRPALADKRGEADFVSTPEGKNWFYEEWRHGQDADRPEYWSRRYPSWVNRVMFPGGEDDPEIQLMRETTLEEWFLQEIAAEFTAVVGRIFGEFAEDVHVTHTYEFHPEWPNYIAFDWGFANPLAAIEFQVAPDDTIYVWREHYVAGRTLEWHVANLQERKQPPGYHLDLAFGDCADPDAVEYVSRHLVYCEADDAAKSNWLTSVRLVKKFLQTGEHGRDGSGRMGDPDDDYGRPIERPKFYVSAECVETIEEFLEYKTKRNVGANEFSSARVVGSGVDDHAIDALRYAFMHLWEIGVQHHLSEVSDLNRGPSRGRQLVRSGGSVQPETFFQYDGLQMKRF